MNLIGELQLGEPFLRVGCRERFFQGRQAVVFVGQEDDHGQFPGLVGKLQRLKSAAVEIVVIADAEHKRRLDGFRRGEMEIFVFREGSGNGASQSPLK